MEKVSVIVPVYKTEQYLHRCIKSILRQDHSNIEVILVDDGSPDNSGHICDLLSDTDKRIHVIHKQNGGLSSARNAGIEAVSGEYICFVDSDDYIEKDYISTLYRAIKDYDADIAKINYREVSVDNYSEKTVGAEVGVFRGAEVPRAFLELMVDSACVFMYKRSLIGQTRFREGKTSEDIPFNFEICNKAQKLVYIPICKYYYYHNPESISNGPLDKNMYNYLAFREEIYRFYEDSDDEYCREKSESMYARAAMGLMSRMALYGHRDNIDEKEYKELFSKVFSFHKKAFYADSRIPVSRKVLAVLVFRFYPIVRLFRGILK